MANKTKTEIGREGEEAAVYYLKTKGYTIIQTNWHWHHYELDIIAMHGENLVIIEVKTRAANYLVSPEEAIDKKKIRRIVQAADAYVRRYNIDKPVRFDIITLIQKADGGYVIDHIDDAFFAPLR